MATTTPNFGWTVPTSTDLVKDGATAIETLGDGIDASFVDLKGGTTGQLLSKASGTDLDYTWVDANSGDITGVTAGTGISGGGTSGTVTVTNSMATAIDAKGDLIAGTGADAFSRLAVGTNDQVLTADSSTATGLKWATSAAGGMTLLSTTSLSGATTTISSISGAYKDLIVYIKDYYQSMALSMTVTINGDTTASNYQQFILRGSGSTNGTYVDNGITGIEMTGYGILNSANDNFSVLYIPDYANATTKKVANGFSGFVNASSAKAVCNNTSYYGGAVAAVTSLGFIASGGTWSAGTVEIYGVK